MNVHYGHGPLGEPARGKFGEPLSIRDSADQARARILKGDDLKEQGNLEAAQWEWVCACDSPALPGKERARVYQRLADANGDRNLREAVRALWGMAAAAVEELDGFPLAVDALLQIAAILERKPTEEYWPEQPDWYHRGAAALIAALEIADPGAAHDVKSTIPDADAWFTRATSAGLGGPDPVSPWIAEVVYETGRALAAGETSMRLWALTTTMAREIGTADAQVLAVKAQLETAFPARRRSDGAAVPAAIEEMCGLLDRLRGLEARAFLAATAHVEERAGIDLDEICPGLKLTSAVFSSEDERVAACPVCREIPVRVEHRGMNNYPPVAMPDKVKQLEPVMEVRDLSTHRYATNVTRLLKCPLCGTYYHDQTYEDEGEFFMAPRIHEITLRRCDVPTTLAFLEAFVADPESALLPAHGQLASAFIDGKSRPTATIEQEARRRALQAAGEELGAVRRLLRGP